MFKTALDELIDSQKQTAPEPKTVLIINRKNGKLTTSQKTAILEQNTKKQAVGYRDNSQDMRELEYILLADK